MPRYSGVTFGVQRVEKGGEVSGYVVSGFVNRAQLQTLREFVDSDGYKRSDRWRGQYQELAQAIVTAVDAALSESK
ncbi:MAG TPA: hypothetical protein GXZ60_11640 [Intrasporangiaceae bacterium]|nr:hypothetical protein [Intrasporangiaceae bacterium]